VGKSPIIKQKYFIGKGHPHVCGEEIFDLDKDDLLKGTPPRVWGRVCLCLVYHNQFGDTPTCVGKSLSSGDFIRVRWGHPHVCGEENIW